MIGTAQRRGRSADRCRPRRRRAAPKRFPRAALRRLRATQQDTVCFCSDPRISFKGLVRALWRTVGQGDTEGGSAITRQHVKNVHLTQNQTVGRKFTEAVISLKPDNRMSKDDILEGCLDTSWLGCGTYGIQRTAQAYCGKDVTRLSIRQATFLASLLKGAGLYDPTLSKANHERAEERWSWIADRMVKSGKRVSPALTDSLKAAHPALSAATATGKSGTTADDTAARYAGTAQSVSTAVAHRMDLATFMEPLPSKGIAGTSADSVPYAVWPGAMGLG